MKFLNVFYFCGSFLPSWIRIRIRNPAGRFTDLQATDGVVHGVGLAGDVLLAVDNAGQAAQVRQVDPRCENLSVSAVHDTRKRES
jgi:hypothetical protein